MSNIVERAIGFKLLYNNRILVYSGNVWMMADVGSIESAPAYGFIGTTKIKWWKAI